MIDDSDKLKTIALIILATIVTCLLFNVSANGVNYAIPSWMKNNAKWWSEGEITDDEFTAGVQYLIQKGVVYVPIQNQSVTASNQIPSWVKTNAGLWATGDKTSDDFEKGIQYLEENGILKFQSKVSETSNEHISNNNAVNKVSSKSQIILSDDQLVAMASNKYSDGNVPLGDGKYVTSGPKKGYVYLCHVPPTGQGAQGSGPWIHGDTWNFLEKLSVSGSVSWPNAFFTNVISDTTHTLSGNALPVENTTGIFPISVNDQVHSYDQNPSSISSQSFSIKLPENPVYSDTPYCMGLEVGVMLSGVPLNDGFDAELRDAPAHEAQDSCNGHPQVSGVYHYHSLSSCFKNADEKSVLGYALDGFPITGPKINSEKYLTTNDLDECHGITSTIIEDGIPTTTYHYVMTYDFPYSASCFRGEPVQYMVIGNAQGGPNQNGPNQNGPPQEAINACNEKSEGNSCSFVSPRGDTISGICQMTPSSSIACVPH